MTSTSSVCAEWSRASERRFRSRARLASEPRVAVRYAPSTRNRQKIKTRKAANISLHLLEHDARHLQAASLEPFGEARANSRGAETTNHTTLTINARALELENLLHRDRLAF